MNTRKRVKLIAAITGGLSLTVLLVVVVYAATVNIDTFNAGEQNLTVGSSTPVLSNTVSASGDVLSDTRDAQVNWGGGAGNISFQMDYDNSNQLKFSAGSGVTGTATVTWDGDSDPGTLSPTGLNGADLVDSSPENDGIYMAVLNCDHDAILTLIGYEDGSNYEALSITVKGNTNLDRLDLFFPFSDFIVQSGTGADWSSLGALVLEIDGTLDDDLDLTIDFMEARDGDDIREYGDLPDGAGGTPDYSDNSNELAAYHVPSGLTLGYNLDAEDSDNTSTNAAGDDVDAADDEDGVVPLDVVYWDDDGIGTVQVRVNGCPSAADCAYINGWIDWNNDGDFDDTVFGASEQIIGDYSMTNEQRDRSFVVPTTWSAGYYYARFRVCDSIDECDSPSVTNIDSGEVEDYRWILGPTAVSLSAFDAAWDGDKVQVTWETAMELDTVGFNVWRSEGPKGDSGYVQVNTSLIPSVSPGGTTGGTYSFVDTGVGPETVYHYKLEELEVSGATNWYGPTSTGGSAPTSVTLASFDAAPVWQPVAAGIAASAGLVVIIAMWRRKRQHA